MTSELSQQRNDAITYFTCSIISRHWELFFQNLLLEEVLMVRNTVKNGQSSCSTVICTKWSVFHMQFHLIVVSIFLKTCVKDHGDTSTRLQERRIWLVCIKALLLAVIFKPLNKFLRKFKNLEINRPFMTFYFQDYWYIVKQ